MTRNAVQPVAQRDRALELFIGGATTAEVAAALRVDRSTAWRMRWHPMVAAAVHAARVDRIAKVEAEAAALAVEALETVAGIMRDPAAPHAVRLRAAAEVLDRVGVGSAHELGDEAAPPERARVSLYALEHGGDP